MNGKPLNGRIIYVGIAQKKRERQKEMSMHCKGRNLYVKYIHESMSDEQFKSLFCKYGHITSCKIERDEHGHSRGFGFVCFSSEEAAKAATEMHGYRPRPLYVVPALQKEERRAQLGAQCLVQNQVSQSQINTFQPSPIYPQDQQMKEVQAQFAGLTIPIQMPQNQYPSSVTQAQMSVPQQTSIHNSQLLYQPYHGLRTPLVPGSVLYPTPTYRHPFSSPGLPTRVPTPGLPLSPTVPPPPEFTPSPSPGISPHDTGPSLEEYCARTIYLVHQESTTLDIHFVVTSNMVTCIAALDRYYKLQYKGATHFGTCQSIEFGSVVISLDIPINGIDISGWKISPRVTPKVTKKQVDNFKPGMMPPCIQLTAEYTGNRRTIPSIRHCMKLIGAGEHFTDIIISLPPPDSVMSKPLLPTPEQPLLSDLQKELLDKASDIWEFIGISLKIDTRVLDQIKSNNNNSRARLIEMLKIWLRRVDPPPCWSAIADAIQELGDQLLADSLRSKYCYMDCDSSS